ncbi:K02A2.6-like, partial [Cordylochernes scorpioides]
MVKQETQTKMGQYHFQSFRNPSIFTGERNQNPEKWLKEFHRVARYNCWDDSMCLANVYFFLQGTAHRWYENVEEKINSWGIFVKMFSQNFGHHVTQKNQLAENLKTRAQGKEETSDSYIQDVLHLCREVNPAMMENEIVAHLTKGISEEIYQSIIILDIATIDEFIKWCRKIEASNKKRVNKRVVFDRLPNVATIDSADSESMEDLIRRIVREEVHRALNPESTTPEPSSLKEIIREEIEKNVASISKPIQRPPPRQSYPNQTRTFSQVPRRHVKRYCRERRQWTQRPEGHAPSTQEPQMGNHQAIRSQIYRRQSPYPNRGRSPRRQSISPDRHTSQSPRRYNLEKKLSVASSFEGEAAGVKNPPSSTAAKLEQNYVEIIIDDIAFSALVDSGSSFSVISDGLRRQLKKTMFKDSGMTLKVADGKNVTSIGRCTISLSINGLEQPLEFIVLPNSNPSIILGWDFLEASNAVIDCGRAEIRLEEAKDVLNSPASMGKVVASRSVVIPAESAKLINVMSEELNGQNQVLFEPSKKVSIGKGLTLPCALFRLSHNKGKLWIVNSGTTAQIVPKGMCLGKIQRVEENNLTAISECSEFNKEVKDVNHASHADKDSALEWYADEIISNPSIKRWEVVKEKLIQRFGSYNANPIVSASHRRLKREESIENYFQDKIRLLNQTHLTKEEKIHLLTDGLPNDWKDLIVAAQPTDATKWFHIAASIEQNRASIQFKPKNKIHLATKNNDNRKNVCPFWCPICSKKGIKIKHWVTDCEDYDPNYKKDRPNQNTSVKQVCGAPELLNVSTLTNTPTQGAFKLINISVEVNGIPAQAFVDTGATVSIINWRLFKRTRLQLQPNSDIHISQADGVTRTCGSLQTKVRIDKLIKPVTLHVMKNFKYPLLIGLDVASLFNLLIDVKDKTIYTKFDGLQNPILVNHLEEIREHELKKILEHNRNVFSQHAIDLGKVAIQHKIITKSEQPISLRPYRRPLKEYEEIAEQVKELLEHKLIRISDSPWAFPVVMVPKKDGNKRMCIDYRRLNEITLDDRQPLPHIQDMFDRLHGSRFFSTLDVAWGYWQIEMDPQSIQKTAFVTNDGHYEFLVMPFGLKNAASTFQRIIQHILGELLWKGTCSFQDDILVYTKTWQEHIELLSKVFDKLRQYNMKLKLSKCIFGRTEVKYLGHIISHNQLKPDPGKVKSIQDFPRPDTVKKVHQFMGLANYYRKFVKDFSKISFPLVRLTRKNQPFIWNEEVEESFAKLKMALSTKPVLAIYNPDYPLNLSSKSCNIVHRSGKQQTHVDALSRLPVVNIATQELQEHQQNSDLSFLKNSHTHDGVVMIKQRGVFKAVVPNSLTKKILEEYHDSLSHPSITKTCKLITQCYWWKGITTDIKNYVRSCKSCQLVKVRHEPTLGEMITPTSNIQPLQMIGCDTIVLGTAAANTKHKFIQVFVDHATRYLWAYPTITNTAQAVTQCLDKIIKSVNSINTILTDNGKNFISKEFNKFLSLQGIKHTYTSPYHPQCNGICEKLSDTIMTKLRIAVLEKPRCKWSSLLPQVVKNYNSTPHDVTGFSPLFLMYGIGNVPEFADQTPITIEEARKKASLRTEQSRSKWKIKHDSHHPKSSIVSLMIRGCGRLGYKACTSKDTMMRSDSGLIFSTSSIKVWVLDMGNGSFCNWRNGFRKLAINLEKGAVGEEKKATIGRKGVSGTIRCSPLADWLVNVTTSAYMNPAKKKKKAYKPIVNVADLEREDEMVISRNCSILSSIGHPALKSLHEDLIRYIASRTEMIKALATEVENLTDTLESFAELDEIEEANKPKTACRGTQTCPAPSCKETSSHTDPIKPATPAPAALPAKKPASTLPAPAPTKRK